jgi:2-polyprenyl-3-methyl-5-hydroxy-6-metoxy-1,4-benzoquinol methylase
MRAVFRLQSGRIGRIIVERCNWVTANRQYIVRPSALTRSPASPQARRCFFTLIRCGRGIDPTSTEERWQVETPYVADLIGHALPTIRPGDLLLDYGCGVGRIAKELIARHRCRVVGVDIDAVSVPAASFIDVVDQDWLHFAELPGDGVRWRPAFRRIT